MAGIFPDNIANDIAQLSAFKDAGGDAQAVLSLARERDNNLATNNQVLLDRAALTPFDFEQKYGSDVARTVDQLDLNKAVVRDIAIDNRSGSERLDDNIRNAVIGLNSSLGGIATLGAAAINPELGVNTAQLINDYRKWATGNQSEDQQEIRTLDAIRASLDSQDNKAQFEEDIKTDGPLIANLKSFGRDAMAGVSRMIEDPAVFETGVSEGIGSLFAAGPIAKGLGAIGAAITKIAAPTAATVPLAIGLMEGGGAYQQVANEVMELSHESLLKSSPGYKQLINNGMSQEAAKKRVAAYAATTAAAIQGPIAGITGKLVAGFEAAPLATKGITDTARNLLTETIEEGIQSLTGEVSQNIGMTIADKDTNVLDNVGSATVQGAAYGLGSAGVTQAPGLALKTSADLVVKGITKTSEAILARGDRLIAANETASPVSEENIQIAINTANENTITVANDLRTLAQEASVPVKDIDSFINEVTTATKITPEEIPEELRSSIRETDDRFVALADAARLARNEEASKEDRISAGNFILDQLHNNTKLFTEDLPEFLTKVPQDREEYINFENYSKVLQAIGSTPSIREAVLWASEQRQSLVETITPQVVNNTVNIAKHNPQNINSEVATRVLAQADRGEVSLTPEQRSMVQGASSLLRAAQIYNQATQTEETSETAPEIITRQIETEGGFKPHQLSMEQHVRRINDAVASGNMVAAKERVTNLGLFARHMRNKINALIQNYNEGTGRKGAVKYQTLGSNHRWMPEAKWNSIFIDPNNEKSVNLARRIYAEAQAVTSLANNMAEIYSQFGIKSISLPNLPSLVPKEGFNERDLGDNQTEIETQQPTTNDNSELSKVAASQPTSEIATPVSDVKQSVIPQEVQEEVSEITQEPVQVSEEQTTVPIEETLPEVKSEEPVAQSKVAETETTVLETEEDTIPKNIKELYPNLIQAEKDGTKKENYFHKAFKLPKEIISRMSSLINPLKELKELLGKPNQLVDFIGSDVDYTVTKGNRESLQELLSLGEKARAHLKIRLREEFGTKKDSSGKSLMDRFLAGEEVNRYERGRILNILERTNSGLRYNPTLLETAIIAGLDWALNSSSSFATTDRADVEQLIGGFATQADIDDFNRGTSVDLAVQSLAAAITKYWGVSKNNNISDTYTKGIPEAVAKEVLYGLQEAGLITLGSFNKNGKTFNRVWVDERSDSINNLIESLNGVIGANNLLADIALVQPERTFHIGQPSTKVADTQLRNALVKNTPQQLEAIRNEQNTPFYVNPLVHGFMKAMSEKAFMLLLGGRDYNQGDLNINYEASVEGKNRGLLTAYRNIMSQVESVFSYAEKQGMPSDNVPSYFEYNITRVGRLQMMGLNNPQSDKLAREIFMPTKTTLDLSNPAGADAKRFWMTVGQGIGLKTAKLTRDQVYEKATKETLYEGGQYYNVVNALQEWLNNPTEELSSDLIEMIRIAAGSDLTMHNIHSLLAVAKYMNAINNGDNLSNYTHYNYLEADGKTNGPINSLALLTTGKFTPNWLKLVAKGGFFIGSKDKTLNQHVQTEDGSDLYEEVTRIFSENQTNFFNYLQDKNPKLLTQFQTLLRVMSALNVDISYNPETNELEMKRGVSKNPLTISIYGSGIDGIAANFTAEIIDMIYEKISEALETGLPIGDLILTKEGKPYGQAEFSADLDLLTKSFPKVDRETQEIELSLVNLTEQEENHLKKRTAKNFTFDGKEFNALKANIRIFFINQMYDAIQTGVMGNVSEATQAIQQATQIQSIILSAMFRNEIIARLADKKLNKPDDYRDGDFLSQEELNQIYSDLMGYSPLIETGTQTFFMSGGEKSDLFETVTLKMKDGTEIKVSMPERFSRALDNTLSTPAYVYGPQLAGVRGVPSLVIGTGDGQMMLNASTMENAPQGTLKIFDGMNMPASQIDNQGKQINEAVYQTWSTNPLQHVADSFKGFLRNNPLETLLDKDNPFNTQYEYLLTEMTKAVLNIRNPKELIRPEAIQPYLETVGATLDRLADEVSIRQEVLKDVQLSIDQMASAEAPFNQEGEAIGKTPEEISSNLNNRYDNVVTKRNINNSRTAVEAPNNKLNEAINEISILDKESGVRTTDAQNLNLIAKILPKDQRDIVVSTLKNLTDSGYKVVFGSTEQINNYQLNNHPYQIPGFLDYYGMIDPETKTIYIANISSETIAHELIHAATIDKTRAFYKNIKSLSKQDQDAFIRLEGLMREWLLQTYSNESEAAQEAYRQATATVNGYINNRQDAEALNEFMAWSLSNQNIIDVQQKTKIQNPLFRILTEAYKYIKNIIWGTKFAVSVKDNMFSNIRFNTRVLMATPTRKQSLIRNLTSVAMYQSPSFGSNNRLSNLRNNFTKKIAAFIRNGERVTQGFRQTEVQLAMVDSSKMAQEFAARGFSMNMQELSTFSMIQAALAVETDLNKASLSRIEEVYSQVIREIKVEDFMINPQLNDPADRYQAQEKFDVLNGVYLTQTDSVGRSSLMSSFLALSAVHDGFRAVLARIRKPQIMKKKDDTLDSLLTNMASSAMDNLAISLSGEGKQTASVKDAIDSLTENLIENVGNQQTFIEQQVTNSVDAIDNFIANNINNLSEKVIQKSNEVLNNNPNAVVAGGARLVRFAATLINETTAEQAVNGVISALNQGDGLVTLREFINEIVGRTKENSSVFDMISSVRAAIQQTRQQFREKLPEHINSKFTKPLTDKESTVLFKGIGKTDLAALYAKFGVQGAIEILTDPARQARETSTLEQLVRTQNPAQWIMVQQKARQLALYLNTGVQGKNLLRNAYAVARLFGEAGSGNITNDYVNNIDQLITLYAISNINSDEISILRQLNVSQSEGVKFALSYLVGLRSDELSKVNSDITRANHYKGYIPSENQLGVSLIVVDDTEHARLIQMGYSRIGPYNGSSADLNLKPKSYYFTPVSGRATYNQGVLQTVHQTVSGIDPRNGFTTGELTAGRIDDPQRVADIKRSYGQSRATNENLLPVYNDLGDVIAYERGIDPNQTIRLNKNTNLSQMIGAWRGRQVEERLANEFNKVLIDNLYTIWKDGKKNKRNNEFINLATSKDPVHQDAWKLIPQDIKDYIDSIFGSEGFRVRRDMINDAVGFRSASVGDLWTGRSRLNPAIQKNLQRVAMGIFGNKAYTQLVNSEKFIQNLVTEAKVLIVVKSIVVPAANLMSNAFQLMTRGVPIRSIIHGLGSKTVELNDYIKRREKELILEAELLAAKGANNNVQIRKIETEIQSIKDSYKRMAIWPLIEAGEFSAITDGGLTQEDLALSKGKWTQFVESLANRVPDGLKTPARYALITRDTALFQGLMRSVQYGDFLSKAILYDDLTKRKKVSKKDALAQINEEFINYNRLAGRTRNYAESIGLVWFWNFKLRAMKVGVHMLRHHPLRSLLSIVGSPNLPIVGSIGSPMTDNFFNILTDGKLGHSIGPGMGLSAPFINPWANIIK